MPSASRDPRFIVIALTVILIALLADKFWRRGVDEVNPHDPAASRIAAFELQPGEVGVTVRVRLGQESVSAVTVWADRCFEEDDDTTSPR